jgi:hypothetical protein
MNYAPQESRASSAPSGPGRPERAGWVESLPFLLAGGVAFAVAIVLLLVHSPAALAHLPVWTYLLAGGSIALVGGTVATLVGEPITNLPGENGLIGSDLIVVSRARWTELNQMEEWVEGRLVPPTAPALARPVRSAPASHRPAPNPRVVARPTPASTPDAVVPTLDDLLTGLPPVPEGALPLGDEPWSEDEESRETPPAPSTEPLPTPPPAERPVPGPIPARSTPPAPPRAAPSRAEATSSPGKEGEEEPPADLERLLSDLEIEAVRAVEANEVETALPDPGALTCVGCGRAVDATQHWDHCDKCLGAYCAKCEDQLLVVGARKLCPTCRSARRRSGR